MSSAISHIALMAAQSLPDVTPGADVPEWVHLLPTADGDCQTGDKRGPYHVTNAAQMIAESFSDTDRLPIDENHATDLAAPKGLPSPARGWITELQAREDGIWGKVEWSAVGRDLLQSRAYRALSPVIAHTKDKLVTAIRRASLVNNPNLRGLTALNMENFEMTLEELLAELAKALGLDEGAGAKAVIAAVKSRTKSKKGGDKDGEALQSQLGEIGVALGLGADSEAADILVAAQAASADDYEGTIVALQSELTNLATQLNTLTTGTALNAATAFVDGAIADKRVGVSPSRDRFIAMHQKDPDDTEAIINGMPKLGRTVTTLEPPAAKDGEISLNAEQRQAARLLGVSTDDYAKTLETERDKEEAL